MSSFGQNLDLLIRLAVTSENLEGLTAAEGTIKRLLNAQGELDKARNRSQAAIRTYTRLQDELNQRIEQETRRTLENLITQRQITQAQEQRRQRVRDLAIASANAAAAEGNYEKALSRLNTAMAVSNRLNGEAAAVRQRIARVEQQQIAATEKRASATAKLAVDQAKYAASLGKNIEAEKILQRVMLDSNLTSEQRRKILTALERQYNATANAARRMATAQVRDLRAAASTSVRGGDFAGAVGSISAAQALPDLTDAQRSQLAQDLIQIESAKQRAIERTALAFANAAIENSRYAASTGQLVQSERILQQSLLSSNLTAEQRRKVLIELEKAYNRTAAAADRLRQSRETRASDMRDGLVRRAGLFAQRGDFDQAEALLGRAGRGRVGDEQRLAIENKMLSVSRARQKALFDEAMGEAQLAKAMGQTRREVQILTALKERDTLTTRQRVRVTNELAAAEQRLAANTALARSLGVISAAARGVINSFNIMTRILASAVLIGFTIRTVFRGLDRLIIAPIRGLFTEVLRVTDEFRRMETSISGITGSLTSARDVTRDIRLATRGLPITTLEGLTGLRGLAFTPATAAGIQGQTAQGRPAWAEDILRVLTSMATIDPEQGIKGAQFALREALAGEFRSLRFRFEISPQVVAGSIGKTLEQLKVDPTLVLPAMKAFTDSFVGPEAIAAFSDLLSTQGNLIKGRIQEFLLFIGNSGIYDHVVGFLKNINEAFTNALTSGPNGDVRRDTGVSLALVSDTLIAVFDKLIAAADRVISSFTGVDVSLERLNDGNQIDQLAKAFAGGVETLGEWTGKIILFTALFADKVAEVARFLNLGDFGSFDPEVVRADLEATRAAIEAQSTVPQPQAPSTFEEVNQRIAAVIFGRRTWEDDLKQWHEVWDTLIEREKELSRRLTLLTAADISSAGRQPESEAEKFRRRGLELGKQLGQQVRLMNQKFGDLPHPSDEVSFQNQFVSLRLRMEQVANREGDFFQSRERVFEQYRATLDKLVSFTTPHHEKKSLLSQLASRVAEISGSDLAAGTNMGETLRGFFEAADKGMSEDSSRALLQNTRDLMDSLDAILLGASDVMKITSDDLKKIWSRLGGVSDGPFDLTELLNLNIQSGGTPSMGPEAFGVGGVRSVTGVLVRSLEEARKAGGEIFDDMGMDMLGMLTTWERVWKQIEDSTTDRVLLNNVREQIALIEAAILRVKDIRFTSAFAQFDLLSQLPQGPNVSGAMASAFSGGMSQIESLDVPQERILSLIPMLEKYNQALRASGISGSEAFRMTGEAVVALRERMKEQLALLPEDARPEFERIVDAFDAASADLLLRVDDTAIQIKEAFADMAQSVSASMASAFGDALVDLFNTSAANIRDIAYNLVLAVQRAVIDMIVQMTLIRSIMNPLMNSAFGLTGENALPVMNLFGMGSAKGNIVGPGGYERFAKGGVVDYTIHRFAAGGMVNSPTLFGMAGGRMGLMGEAGTEAIMPSGRDRSGRHSVYTSGGGMLSLTRDQRGQLAVDLPWREMGSMRGMTSPGAGSRQSGGGVTISLSMNNHFPPGTSPSDFRQSTHQAASNAARTISRVIRHDGLN